MLSTENFKLKGKTYKVGFSFRSIREFELLAGKSITKCTSTWDNLMYFFCTLRALNPEFKMTLDEFTEVMDENPELLAQFQTKGAKEEQPKEGLKKKWTNKQISTLWTLSLLLLVLPVWLPIISIIIWIGASLWLLGRVIGRVGKRRGYRS